MMAVSSNFNPGNHLRDILCPTFWMAIIPRELSKVISWSREKVPAAADIRALQGFERPLVRRCSVGGLARWQLSDMFWRQASNK